MTGVAFTVAAAVLVDVRPALDTAEYDGTSAGHLVDLYWAARDEDEQTQLAAAVRARSTALWGWLLDERTFQVLADAPNLPCLTEQHTAWLRHVRAQIDAELRDLAAQRPRPVPAGASTTNVSGR